MIKIVTIFFIFLSSIFAENSTEFKQRQEILQKVKNYIVKEELIAKAYQQYILDKYTVPELSNLYSSDYLGVETDFSDGIDTNLFNDLSLTKLEYSYGLKEILKDDSNIKNIYESDIFRKNTLFANGKLYIYLDDEFVRHLYHLISRQTSNILADCDDSTKTKYCKKDNHIFIYDDNNETNLLIWYHIDKFKTGPYMITKDISTYLTNEEFSYIPKGVIMYDDDGTKYIKTSTSIEKIR